MDFEPEQTILKQGEMNNNLFFLLVGTADVYVDSGLVAKLQNKGDLLGEMSVITSTPCSATIVAKTPTKLVCVDIEKFKQILGDDKTQFDHILYKIYSRVLVDKINQTNQRANKVEMMLQALDRAKNELQELNIQIERRVVERTQLIQTQLQELLHGHLYTLKDSLRGTVDKVGNQVRPLVEKNLTILDDVAQFLEPLVQRFNLEISLKNKRVLIALSERKIQTLSKLALGGTGINIEIVSNLEEAKNNIIENSPDVVLVDGEALELTDMQPAASGKTKFVFIGSKGIRENLQKLLELKHLPHMVFIREENRTESIRSIMTAVTKLCGPNIFGLEKYLNLGAAVQEMKIRTSDDREIQNDRVREYFAKLGARASILDNVKVVVEELLMNAIYDAPTDVAGAPLYNSLQRTVTVNLKPNQQGTLRYATDGTWLVVSVQDPFGGLTAKTIMNYLDSCYGGREGSMQTKKGVAGRGLHQIVESSTFVVFNIQPKKQTEVIAFFDMIPQEKKDSANPTLHYFEQN